MTTPSSVLPAAAAAAAAAPLALYHESDDA